MSIRIPGRLVRQGLAALLALGMLPLSGCRSDRVSVNPADPDSPQHPYTLHELALLQLAADDIQALEHKKQYGAIYEAYGSPAFKKSLSRRRFMIIANCVETHLGDLEEYNRNQIGFRRETVDGKSLDVLSRRVSRKKGTIEEQMVFVPDGINFKLNSLYWIAKDKQFLQCVDDSARLEAETDPDAVPAASPVEVPEAEESPKDAEAPGEEPPAATPPAQEASGTGATPDEAKPSPPAVQEMTPSDVKKDALPPTPAGAGAVKDIRPAKPEDAVKKPDPAQEEPGGLE